MIEAVPEWLQMLIVGIGGFGAGGYGVYRRLRSDSNSDFIDRKSQALINNLSEQLVHERDNSRKLGEVIDRLAKERNEAVQALGALEAQIEALKREVMRQEELNTQLKQEVLRLREDILVMARSLGPGSEQHGSA